MRFLTQIFIVMTNINQTNFLLSLFFYEESIIVLIKNLTISIPIIIERNSNLIFCSYNRNTKCFFIKHIYLSSH